METQVAFQTTAEEQAIINIMRELPSEHSAELLEFAKFLSQRVAQENDDLLEGETATEDADPASAEKWDRLFAKSEAKSVMREMAREAREDDRAGRTTDIAVAKDGHLTPA